MGASHRMLLESLALRGGRKEDDKRSKIFVSGFVVVVVLSFGRIKAKKT